jgi:hypothetical protein
VPLFSFWTLDLHLDRPRCIRRTDDTVSAIARRSPRFHLRRGHPVRRAGKWWWRQACAVGRNAAGMVHKDYKV